jgi:hypothetical protein
MNEQRSAGEIEDGTTIIADSRISEQLVYLLIEAALNGEI